MTLLQSNSILTVSGREIAFPHPDPKNITLYDIAHALSRAPRWAGHTDIPWTVAEHSILVAELYRIESNDTDPEVYRGLLLHDATEAFLADLPSPIKALLPDYRDLETTLYYAIYGGLQCDPPPCEEKKLWDRLALLLEARDLFHIPRHPWQFGLNEWPDYPSIQEYVNPYFSQKPPTSSEIRGAYCAAYAAGYHSQTPPSLTQVRVSRQRESDHMVPVERGSLASDGQSDPRDPACGSARSPREGSPEGIGRPD
jgi:hypothetical protein